MDNEIYFEINKIVNLVVNTPNNRLKEVLDQAQISDNAFNVLLSRYYAHLAIMDTVFVGAIEKNIDDMEYKKRYFFNNYRVLRRVIEIYIEWTVLPPDIIKEIISLDKDKYMMRLDQNYKFMGYNPQYISNNLDILTISFSKTKTKKMTKLEWAIVISSAYIYEVFTKSLSLDYDNLDLEQIIDMLSKDSNLFDKIINGYKQYRLVKGEKLVLDETVMGNHYNTLLKLNPTILIELVEKTFYKQRLARKIR